MSERGESIRLAQRSHKATLYLGIDGGQSSTTALIGNARGEVLGRGRGGPCNHVTGPAAQAKFLSAVGQCLNGACQEAGLDCEQVEFAGACLGLSGGKEDKEAYARQLIRSHRWKFTNDAEIALTGALKGGPGIIVIAGTGSIALGRDASGRIARAGGWGYIFGDEGGAFYLVKEALRASLRAEEGWGRDTVLRAELLQSWGANTANELLHRWYGISRAEVAKHAATVERAAALGDVVAKEICESAAKHLAEYASAIHGMLFATCSEVAVSYVGGVFQSEIIRYAFSRQVQLSGARAQAPAMSPAHGALLEAMRLDGNNADLVIARHEIK